jgi:predicted phosphodiesterase
MSGKQKEMGVVAEQYCIDYPQLSSLGLARLLKQESPLLFASVEAARDCVRYYRGAKGEVKRNQVRGKIIPRSIPEPISVKYEPYQLPKINDNCLILADLHIPFHDKTSIEIAVKYGVEHKVNTVILLGDIIDCYELSKFVKKPNVATFQDEREYFWELIDYINEQLPHAQIFWYEGNHEKRWQAYMLSHAPEIFGVTDFTIPELFNLRELGITWIDRCQYIRAGKMNILHGHEYFGGMSSVNPARWLFLKSKSNACMAHRHQVSVHSGKDINGKITTCWSIGCLCQLNPEYMPLNEWAQGFAHIHLFKEGNFLMKNHTIINHTIY